MKKGLRYADPVPVNPESATDESDAELAGRVQAGDRVAEAELYRRLARRVRLYGLRHLRDPAAADDLVQDVILLTFDSLRAGKVRERERLYALTARCAHLGCTVNWFGELRVFRCPCHGSEYHSNGANFAGPAPRPLDRLRIELAGEGQIVVDTAIVYGPERFDADGAFVRL